MNEQSGQSTQIPKGEEHSKLEAAVDTAKEKMAPIKEKAEEVVDEAKSVAGQVSDEAKSSLDTRRVEAADQLHGLAQALRNTSTQLENQEQNTFANYSNQVADQIDHVSNFLQERDINELITEAENFARRQPELFIGGAFTLGLLAARFLKSSASNLQGQANYPQTTMDYRAYPAGYNDPYRPYKRQRTYPPPPTTPEGF